MTIANGTVLCLNVVLLIFLTSRGVTLLEQDPLSQLSEVQRENVNLTAEILGMDIYCIKAPFVIFLKKDEQLRDNFMVMHYDRNQYAYIYSETLEKGAAERNLDVTIGNDLGDFNKGFSFGCSYSFPKENSKSVEIKHLMFADKNTVFHDLNADCFPDTRLRNSDNNGQTQQSADLWYQGKWQERGEVSESDGVSRYRMPDGTIVLFDMEVGQWIPTAK